MATPCGRPRSPRRSPRKRSACRPRSVSGRFAGQVVFITGASSGIGAALAREFARAGADVALAARRVERAAARTRETLGRIDVVVANAGFGVTGPLEALTLDD